jgi:hypothetical protein
MNNTLLEQQLFIKNDLPSRLGKLADHLLQIKSLSVDDAPATLGLIKDCRYLIEWTASEMEIDQAVKLVEIQRQLSSWLFHWQDVCSNKAKLQQVHQDCGVLAQVVLEIG